MIILINILEVFVLGYVLYLQVTNWKKFSDGNGADVQRAMFITNVIVLLGYSVLRAFSLNLLAELCILYVCLSGIGLYRQIDIRTYLRRVHDWSISKLRRLWALIK